MTNKKICLTGGAGQIAYSLIPILLSEDIFQDNNKIDLILLDIEPCSEKLEGVKMEIVLVIVAAAWIYTTYVQ